MNPNSIDYLLLLLDAADQYAEVAALQRWIVDGDKQALADSFHIARVFAKIEGVNSYAIFPEIIGAKIAAQVTAKLIVSAAVKVPSEHRPAVCCAFAKFCVDKENAQKEFTSIGFPPFVLARVLSYYLPEEAA